MTVAPYTVPCRTFRTSEDRVSFLRKACVVREYLHVTANLIEAIQCYQLAGKAFTILVDAICTNQKKQTVRAHHVLLLRNIYSRIQPSLLWLEGE